MSKATTIARNSIYLYIRLAIVMITSLYTVRVVLNSLGLVDFGIYGVAGGVVALFAFLNNTMSSAAQRFLGFEIGKGHDVALRKTFNAIFIIHVAIAILVVMTVSTLGVWLLNYKLDIPQDRLPAANIVLWLSIGATVAQILRTPYNALIVARQKLWFFSITSVFEALLKLGVAFAITRTSYDRLEFYASLVCVVSWLMLLVYAIFCRTNFSESRFSLNRDQSVYRALTSFIGWSFLGSLSSAARGQGVNALLNIFFGPALNAAHGVMTQSQAAVSQFAGSFQMALSPQIYQSYAQGNHGYMHSLVFLGAKLNFFLLAILVFPAMYCMDLLLGIWLGMVPEHAAAFVKWMLVAQLLESVSYPLMIAAAATGSIRNYQLAVAGTTLLNLPLSWLAFYQSSNPESFLYIAVILQIATFGLRVWFLKEMIDLRVDAFMKSVAAPISLLIILGFLLLLLAKQLLGDPNDFKAVISGVAFITISFSCAVFFIGFRSNERKQIIQLVSRKLRK